MQWDELDTPTAHVFSAEPDQETTAIAQLRDLLQSSMKGRHGEYDVRKRISQEGPVTDYRILVGSFSGLGTGSKKSRLHLQPTVSRMHENIST